MKVRELNWDLLPKKDDPFFCEKFRNIKTPLDLEIGCGVGMHPTQYARANPQRTLVAIEHTTEKFLKFENALKLYPVIENLYPVHANAISWVASNIKEKTVDRYFFLYPNPNPKKNDLSKRWHASPFMHFVLKTLKPEGTIFLATNEKFYADEAKVYFLQYWGLVCTSDRVVSKYSDPLFSPRTHFEKKYFERGESLFDLAFQIKNTI